VTGSRELELVEWLMARFAEGGSWPAVTLGIGDDMAIVDVGGQQVLLTADMLLDGVHFDRSVHQPEAIGRKAIACSLSDCAAMAVKPVAATVSVALPSGWSAEESRGLYDGMRAMADTFECAIVGGDTTAWNQRLAIDVGMLAVAYPGIVPIRRHGARVGDVLLVTGPLGGSLLGRHLTFTPRVHEARRVVGMLGEKVHAMMDISDGLSLDLHRLCAASGVGGQLEESWLDKVVSSEALESAGRDGRSPLEHALSDGEDFELLLAVDPSATVCVEGVTLHQVGVVTPTGLTIRRKAGAVEPLTPLGFEHRT